MEGYGGLWRALKGFEGLIKDLESSGRIRRVSEGFGVLWKALEGSEGFLRFRESSDLNGSGGLCRALEGFGGLCRAL